MFKIDLFCVRLIQAIYFSSLYFATSPFQNYALLIINEFYSYVFHYGTKNHPTKHRHNTKNPIIRLPSIPSNCVIINYPIITKQQQRQLHHHQHHHQQHHGRRLLLSEGYEPDIIYTSRLKRAVKSTSTVLNALSAPYLPVYKSWRLNERHYGALTGLKKMDAAKSLGPEVVQAW